MRTLGFKLNLRRIQKHRLQVRGFILVLVGVVFLSGIPIAGVALDEGAPPEVETNGQQLKWSAENVFWDPAKSLVMLTGNVKIVQGETVIVADKAQIFSIKDAAAEQKLNASAVEKFVADGNVRIELEIGVATSEKAIYFTETKILILSGTPARFESDNTITGTITGSTITVNNETGIVTFKNAEAVIFTEGNL